MHMCLIPMHHVLVLIFARSVVTVAVAVTTNITVGTAVAVAVGIVVGVGVRSSVTTTLSLAIPGKVSMPTLGTSIATPTTTFVLAVSATRIIMPRLVWDILAVAIIGADYASIVSNVTVVDVPSIAIIVSTIIGAADVVSNATVAMVYCCFPCCGRWSLTPT